MGGKIHKRIIFTGTETHLRTKDVSMLEKKYDIVLNLFASE